VQYEGRIFLTLMPPGLVIPSLQFHVELEFLVATFGFDFDCVPGVFIEESDSYVIDTGYRVIVQCYQSVVYL